MSLRRWVPRIRGRLTAQSVRPFRSFDKRLTVATLRNDDADLANWIGSRLGSEGPYATRSSHVFGRQLDSRPKCAPLPAGRGIKLLDIQGWIILSSMSWPSRFVVTIKSVFDIASWRKLIRQRDSFDRIENWPDLIATVTTRAGRRCLFANQIPAEIGALCEEVRQLKPKVVVEIGTAKGGTLYLWSRLAQPGGTVISIDKPGEPGSVRPVMRSVYRSFGKKRGVKVITLDCDSHSPQTHAELEQLLQGQPIDFLFIDGDHSYEGVKSDFHDYRRLMAPNGVVAMHDVAHAMFAFIEVPRFWNELAAESLDRTTIVAKPGDSPGIGIVRLKPTSAAVTRKAA